MAIERKILKNKPLVEAIFEIRWELQKTDIGFVFDPYYKIFLENISASFKIEYPFYERLGTADFTEEFSFYNVQHRIRKAQNDWPVIQLGPGILTINATYNYKWEDFYKRIQNVLTILLNYKITNYNFKIKSLVLRYIDAINIEDKVDIFKYLKDNLKIDINICDELFIDDNLVKEPSAYNFSFSFKSKKPIANIDLKFNSGQKEKTKAIIWETVINTLKDNIPKSTEEIFDWVEKSHELIVYKIFFILIKDSLEKKF
jgi:uncharacterized protein (TIGR04255 family)